MVKVDNELREQSFKLRDVFMTQKAYMKLFTKILNGLTLSWRSSWSYRNQSVDLQSKSMDWFLYDKISTIVDVS